MLSKAVISAFKTPVGVLLKIPIPLVAPVTGKLAILSVADPSPAAVSKSVPNALPLLVLAVPPDIFPPLL
mgnify:CR=1 FL=1